MPLYRMIAILALASALCAGDGLPPRAVAADYPVHRDAQNAVIGAAVVPNDILKKLFPPDAARHYIVVEVAFYPLEGQTAYIDAFDFDLRYSAGEVSYPRSPQEIVSVWAEKSAPQPPAKVDVTGEAGVVYTTGRDPATGRSRGLETYTGVGVGPGQPAPPQPLSTDPQAFEARIRDRALPEGPAIRPVAGYLYFALPGKKRKAAPTELHYIKDGVLVTLPLPAK